MKNFTDSSNFAKAKPFHTFFQKTQGNRTMATYLDYILINKNNTYLISQINTKFGNSDHLWSNVLLISKLKERNLLFGSLIKISLKIKN